MTLALDLPRPSRGPALPLPYQWEPRGYQRRLWHALEAGKKRAVAVWHRRAGKDDVCLHWTCCAAHERVGTYWHLLPEASQARKAVWEAVNPKTGLRRIDEAFPLPLRAGTRENEMFIRLKCGSTWQLVGSDNYNSLVGSPPIGVVFSEYALADPNAWGYIRPILQENQGWAVFIFTPRGRNHAATLYDGAKGDPTWFAELLSAEQTGVFTEEQLAVERREYMREYGPDDGEARYRQEYLCSFSAGVLGAYYARQIDEAEQDGRICLVPHDPKYRVITAWDIGIGDPTAIWFVQPIGPVLRVIDYIENSGVGVDWYVRELEKRPYTYARHIWPHDGENKEWGTGKTRKEIAEGLGMRNIDVLPRPLSDGVDDGINAARLLLPTAVFDRDKCARGIDCLRSYRRKWDEARRCYADVPYHDWTSHGADSWRALAMGDLVLPGKPAPLKYPDYGFV